MKQDEIESLLNSFFLSKKDLKSRESFKEFAYSLSDIIINDFATNYLLNNPYLSIYLAHTDGSMLLKKIKDFFAFVLIAPVDELYIKRVHFIGSIHYSIKLEPAKVSYGFWAISEVIYKMAEINEVIKEHRVVLTKLLRFIEHLMNDGYYKEKEKNIDRLQSHSFNAQNELYLGFNIHKLNMQNIDKAIKIQDITVIKEIQNNPNHCQFGKIINSLLEKKRYSDILGFNIYSMQNMHDEWHKSFSLLIKSLEIKNIQQAQIEYQNLKTVTDEISLLLNTALQNSLEDGHLALNSSMNAMKNMSKLFYHKDLKEFNEDKLKEILQKMIEETILSEMSWAIEDIAIDYENKFTKKFTIIKQMRYKIQNIFIAINLKNSNNNNYLKEIINLLLEVLNLHLSVTQREISLISFADKAESANKSKDMFLANMSHELRTPLNAITGFSQILMIKKDTPPNVKEYVEKINIAGKNLLELVNTILDFAKLEAGKMQFNPKLSNISDVLKEVETLISSFADTKKITLKMPNIISLNLYIDSTLFKQVLLNLLTNAIKFTQEGGEVSLSIEYNADNHRYIFEVKDNGIGLSKSSINNLFQAFSQIENSYQKEHKGTGLGLMISKKIIEELHNGRIWVESEEGKGSSFFLSIKTPMVESHTYSIKKAPKYSKNILIVEDSENYQKILIEHLKQTHNMTLTDTVNKAKELIHKNSYDFIILDFFLTDGISSEILQYMEEENIDTPTIVISAEDEIIISSSLAGSSNLECIINKKNIDQICSSLRGEKLSLKL